MRILDFDEIDSTNAEAKRQAEDGNTGPLWITAKRQTAGIGRRGREWVSDTGNLFCTGLFPYSGTPASAARLSFAAALAVAETLDHYIAPDLVPDIVLGNTKIKWPNDVLVGGEKISGILLESGKADGQMWVCVGIGINLMSAPEDTETPATYLLKHMPKREGDFSDVLEILTSRFEHWRSEYDSNGFAPLRTAWLGRAQGIGKPVTARLPNKTIEGTAIGMDMDGGLEIEMQSGERIKIHAGDVFFS